MNKWSRTYLAGVTIQPLIDDIKTGKVHPSAALLGIQQLSEEEKQQMEPALDQVLEVLARVTSRE